MGERGVLGLAGGGPGGGGGFFFFFFFFFFSFGAQKEITDRAFERKEYLAAASHREVRILWLVFSWERT